MWNEVVSSFPPLQIVNSGGNHGALYCGGNPIINSFVNHGVKKLKKYNCKNVERLCYRLLEAIGYWKNNESQGVSVNFRDVRG